VPCIFLLYVTIYMWTAWNAIEALYVIYRSIYAVTLQRILACIADVDNLIYVTWLS
jgi:hypothetical protein